MGDQPYEFKPLTKGQLHTYAKSLQRGKLGLSWDQALAMAKQHEADRAEAYAQVDESLARKQGNGK